MYSVYSYSDLVVQSEEIEDILVAVHNSSNATVTSDNWSTSCGVHVDFNGEAYMFGFYHTGIFPTDAFDIESLINYGTRW